MEDVSPTNVIQQYNLNQESRQDDKNKSIVILKPSDGTKSRYQKLPEIKNIRGFIVNIHDATNYDIDLTIPDKIIAKYKDVICNYYSYQDLNSNLLEFPLNKGDILIGKTYRCRLKGIGINQVSQHTWKANRMLIKVKQLIDRTDGWVTCTLSDIDIYHRLLVEVTVDTCNGSVNLKDYLLVNGKYEDNNIFYPYSGKKKPT